VGNISEKGLMYRKFRNFLKLRNKNPNNMSKQLEYTFLQRYTNGR
jgi:hypothetical protein